MGRLACVPCPAPDSATGGTRAGAGEGPARRPRRRTPPPGRARGAAAARALGESEGRIYARELGMMGRVDEPARRRARLDDLARRYREPALARLRGLEAASEGDRLLISARIASSWAAVIR